MPASSATTPLAPLDERKRTRDRTATGRTCDEQEGRRTQVTRHLAGHHPSERNAAEHVLVCWMDGLRHAASKAFEALALVRSNPLGDFKAAEGGGLRSEEPRVRPEAR